MYGPNRKMLETSFKRPYTLFMECRLSVSHLFIIFCTVFSTGSLFFLEFILALFFHTAFNAVIITCSCFSGIFIIAF